MSPALNHSTTRIRMDEGWVKKKASKTFARTSPSQARTVMRKRPTCKARTLCLLSMAFEHLPSQDAPDLAMQVEEGFREPDFDHVARAREGDDEFADGPGRGSGREHDDAV